MKTMLLISALLTAAPIAAQAGPSYYAIEDLRAECAKSYAEFGGNYAGAQNYGTSYYKDGKGNYLYGDKAYKPCSEAQYAAYLDKADPTLVMAAYPTSAGRPAVKSSSKGGGSKDVKKADAGK